MKSVVRPPVGLFFALVLSLAGEERAHAVAAVGLSSPGNLNDLRVGDVVRIDVTLGNLPASAFAFLITTREFFPSSLFERVPDPAGSSGLSAGTILSLASQRDSFHALSFFDAGSVVGNFSANPPAAPSPIVQNGRYYSFSLRAIAPGSGLVQFDPTASTYAGTDTFLSVVQLPTSGPLAFTISAVPEPTSLMLLGIGAVGLGWARRRKSLQRSRRRDQLAAGRPRSSLSRVTG